MQQTFNDLYMERKTKGGWFSFMLWTFAETAVGILTEHVLQLTKGAAMKNILANPKSAALISFILCLPLALPFIILMVDVKPLVEPLKNLLTVDGQQINTLGRIVFPGGLLLLPAAFILNLQPILVRVGPDQKRAFHTVNLIAGTAILLLITFTWGALLVEEIYCLQGIRCD
ncbi:MAG TPA: hypothetical protein VMJ90_07535 [Anaerolineales bacterium]|nr:hypothetical protein [Anaerolineales bacterium]